MSVDKLVDSTQLDSDLTSVANAIRTKGGTSSQMSFPSGFVSAIENIHTGSTPTGTKEISITENGTTTEDVTDYAYAEIEVAVPASAVDSGTKNITANGTGQDVVGYAAVDVAVPNTYAAGDEGKVVSSGALVAQTSGSTSANGTVDTTLINSLSVSVPASAVVSGTLTVDSSGTKDVTNYQYASVPAGTAGTPTATKGTVSNHAVTVTPSVTNSAGWVGSETKTGTAVTVQASELDSGTKSITANGTNQDVVGYAAVDVAVSPNVGTKSITTNGTYDASTDGYDGYSEVTVNVSGGGNAVQLEEVTPTSDITWWNLLNDLVDFKPTFSTGIVWIRAVGTVLPASPQYTFNNGVIYIKNGAVNMTKNGYGNTSKKPNDYDLTLNNPFGNVTIDSSGYIRMSGSGRSNYIAASGDKVKIYGFPCDFEV